MLYRSIPATTSLITLQISISMLTLENRHGGPASTHTAGSSVRVYVGVPYGASGFCNVAPSGWQSSAHRYRLYELQYTRPKIGLIFLDPAAGRYRLCVIAGGWTITRSYLLASRTRQWRCSPAYLSIESANMFDLWSRISRCRCDGACWRWEIVSHSTLF